MTYGSAKKGPYAHTTHPDNSPLKPKVVTVVRSGSSRPRKKITILLNKRAVGGAVFSPVLSFHSVLSLTGPNLRTTGR